VSPRQDADRADLAGVFLEPAFHTTEFGRHPAMVRRHPSASRAGLAFGAISGAREAKTAVPPANPRRRNSASGPSRANGVRYTRQVRASHARRVRQRRRGAGILFTRPFHAGGHISIDAKEGEMLDVKPLGAALGHIGHSQAVIPKRGIACGFPRHRGRIDPAAPASCRANRLARERRS
jgi:hypothetical protein